jgi:hypothetical protein
MAGVDDFKGMSEDWLAAAYVESVRASEIAEHIGKQNRLIGLGFRIVEELGARGAARPVYSDFWIIPTRGCARRRNRTSIDSISRRHKRRPVCRGVGSFNGNAITRRRAR